MRSQVQVTIDDQARQVFNQMQDSGQSKQAFDYLRRRYGNLLNSQVPEGHELSDRLEVHGHELRALVHPKGEVYIETCPNCGFSWESTP